MKEVISLNVAAQRPDDWISLLLHHCAPPVVAMLAAEGLFPHSSQRKMSFIIAAEWDAP